MPELSGKPRIILITIHQSGGSGEARGKKNTKQPVSQWSLRTVFIGRVSTSIVICALNLRHGLVLSFMLS